ncbi:O-methyltransferase [Campylobacter concisus]|uniref:O-methyltransferase n=1 Tax=Campylobacter concisus TaxID=199 RepID=UPI00122C8A52|nr:O-methyltransferase [Campylobacter concisus]
MSSGSSLPYHLRIRKEIERYLFIEQIRLILLYLKEKPSEYSYVSMAGPFSWDFKKMYEYFDFKYFISYETEEETFKRQKFNAPFSKIVYKNEGIENFINSYPDFEKKRGGYRERLGKVVAWLDYTDFKEHCIKTFKEAVEKVDVGSIVKITVNANPADIAKGGRDDVNDKRLEVLQKRLGGSFNEFIYKKEVFTHKEYPKAVLRHLLTIAEEASPRGSDKKFLPTSSYIYQDNALMLTLTGTIIKKDDEKAFLKSPEFSKWDFRIKKVEGEYAYEEINVPFLSQKEVLKLNPKLPRNNKSGKIALDGISEDEMEKYVRFHKFYPIYLKTL